MIRPSTGFSSGNDMQRGLATLELILATMIIAVLVTVAVPNAALILDTAALDYETKRLYSELRFVQEMGRSSTIEAKGTGGTNLLGNNGGDYVLLTIKRSDNSYQVSRGTAFLREPHQLSYGVTVKLESSNDAIITIYFKSNGHADINGDNKGKIILTSRRGKKRKIIFDNVGRIRAEITND